jgi:hypothetical protein
VGLTEVAVVLLGDAGVERLQLVQLGDDVSADPQVLRPDRVELGTGPWGVESRR